MSDDTLRADLANPDQGAGLVAFKQPASGAVPRTVATKLHEQVTVKDFGAVGDGVADDTAAVQSAVNYIATNGGNLLFPRGTYLMTSGININAATKAFNLCGETICAQTDDGAGITTQLLFAVADGVHAINIHNTTPALTRCVSISNLHILRSTQESKGGGGVGLYLQGVFESYFQNITVSKFDRCLRTAELNFGSGNYQPTIHALFHHCNFRDGSTENILLDGFSTIKFDMCNIIGAINGQDSLITITRSGTFSDSAWFNNCVIISIASTPPPRLVFVAGGFFHQFDGCALEQGTNCFDLAIVAVSYSPTLINIMVNNCHFNGHRTSVLNCILPARVMFSHNRVDGSSQTNGNLLQMVATSVVDMECIIDGNDISFATGFGVYANNIRGMQVANNRFRSTAGNGTAVYLESSTAGCVVTGNSIKTAGTATQNFAGSANVSLNNISY
ncbi:glycosyl hydrolase family 28-related protein [Xanthomonas sp. 3498]|uniref:glycosyl hydrolase family 28-related protein n=1 Tax=Xanthomonas sp. 3498 TaxID=2663863 RepID=UPI001617C2B6|nr:glycosyl hydrolase family 28-related protein [Xanthomonas sp. 3498]MBB5878694.1 hypothetical protein [Xanthomonas sp. 3498]